MQLSCRALVYMYRAPILQKERKEERKKERKEKKERRKEKTNQHFNIRNSMFT